ncbi:MAG TPA: hypothetical protein VIL08_00210 [Limnochorda sp.]
MERETTQGDGVPHVGAGAPRPRRGRARLPAGAACFLIALAVCLTLTLPAWAQEGGPEPVLAQGAGTDAAPLRLHVEGEATYDPETQWLTATRVRVEHGRLTIEAAALEADLGRQEALFSGQVRLKTERGTWEGDQLTYNLASRQFVLGEGWAEFVPAGGQGTLRLRAPHASGTVEHIHVGSATLTTCQLEHPEYHVQAREIEIWPGREMVLRHVVYVEGSIPLFYWPRVTVSLDPDEEMAASPIQPPEIGWTEEDGWYVRTGYYYDTRADHLGLLHVGYHQFSGLGLGVTQRLTLGSVAWTVGADWLQNPPSEAKNRPEAEPRYRLRTRLDVPAAGASPVEASYTATYWEERPESSDRREDWAWEHDLTLTARSGGTSASLRGHQERGREDGKAGLKEGADLSLSQALGPLRLTAASQGRRWKEGAGLHEYLGYQGSVEGRRGSWDGALRGGWTLHSNLLKYETANSWTRFGRAPEGELGYTLPAGLWPKPLTGTRLRLFSQAGRYQEERPAGATGWIDGAHIGVRSSGTRLPLGGPFSLGISTWAGQWWYETEQALSYAGSTWTLQYRPAPAFTGELAYTTQGWWGETPFKSHEEAWKAKERLELLLEARLEPLWAGAYASYDMQKQELDDLVGLVQVRLGERFSVGAAGHYEVREQTWTRYDATLSAALGESWAVEGKVGYALDEHEAFAPVLGQVSLTYTSDCRTFGLRFDVVNKAIWLEYRLNAFPAAPLELGREPEEPSLLDLPNMRAVANEVTS